MTGDPYIVGIVVVIYVLVCSKIYRRMKQQDADDAKQASHFAHRIREGYERERVENETQRLTDRAAREHRARNYP